MSQPQLVFLIAIFFFPSVLGVVTSTTSRITVPAMTSLGMGTQILSAG
ncbi:MAG TPA: hypothetical protein VN901_22505 [Candidatus Acidoferrales bacterium]|nr:hypothetical protein [Candidatus Acidoferrales bacterium]